MTQDEVSEEDVHSETKRLAEWYEVPIEEVLLWPLGDRIIAVRMMPAISPYPVPSTFRRRTECENCHAPASGLLEGHPLCRFCRAHHDPKSKYKWEAL
jgi:hypothetical protein